ncbi:MAG: sulfatase [Acidobacteriales bacterium]|nr:sulfatase [Terriglobales bacterium]
MLLAAVIFLAVYDWLSLTGRLHYLACLLLAAGCAAVLSPKFTGDGKPGRWPRRVAYAVAGWVLIFVLVYGGSYLKERRAIASLPAARPGAPNVLVIIVDTLRADHLSSYGYSRLTTPNLDALAASGVLFENAIAPSSWSLPSHASLMTGRYPSEHGLENVGPQPWLGWGKNGLGGFRTLGEALAAQGYRTGAFSANRLYFTSSLGFGRGFSRFDDDFSSPEDAFLRTLYGRKIARRYFYRSEKSWATRLISALGLNALRDQDSEGSGDYGGAYGVRKRAKDVNREVRQWVDGDRSRPFFACLNYLDVHFPYGVPRDYSRPAWDSGSDRDEYDAGLAYEDDYIGRLLQDLKQQGLQNTLVILTSDHGESLGDHGLSYHGAALYWELVHVPLILSWPGHVPAGVRIPTPVTNAAIPATVTDLTGHPDQALPGPPLNLLWTNPLAAASWPSPISQLAQTDTIVAKDRALASKIPLATDADMDSLVTGQWQLIRHAQRGVQLYDWRKDPGETEDLAHTEQGLAVTRRLAEGFATQRPSPGTSRQDNLQK